MKFRNAVAKQVMAIINNRDKGCDNKYVEEQQARGICPDQRQVEVKDRIGPVIAFFQLQVIIECKYRQEQHIGRPQPAFEKRNKESPNQENKLWRNHINHSGFPCALQGDVGCIWM